MVAFERSYNKGDTRYIKEYATVTITGTAANYSSTACNGALYHAYQITNLTAETSTASYNFVLQGCIEADTPVNWVNLVGTTQTVAGTGTVALATPTQYWPLEFIRPICTSAGTTGASTFKINILGQK